MSGPPKERPPSWPLAVILLGMLLFTVAFMALAVLEKVV